MAKVKNSYTGLGGLLWVTLNRNKYRDSLRRKEASILQYVWFRMINYSILMDYII